jgi:hypothetical protein
MPRVVLGDPAPSRPACGDRGFTGGIGRNHGNDGRLETITVGTVLGCPEFLTVAAVAGMLKVNPQTVRNWIFSTVFSVVSCRDWLCGQCMGAPSSVQAAAL